MDPVRLSFDLPLGRLCAVDIPAEPPRPGDPLWQALVPEERSFLAGLAPARQAPFAAGRVALGAALESLCLARPPILPDARGAPQLPPGVLGSISHKRKLAVGLAALPSPSPLGGEGRGEGARGLGVDLEELRPTRVDLSRRVLTPDEHAALHRLDPADRTAALLLRFSLKEAFFKAANGLVDGPLGFQDLTVLEITADGSVILAGPAIEHHALGTQAWAQTDAPLPGYIVTAVWVGR